MFVFSFFNNTASCSITRIKVIGPYVTIYGNPISDLDEGKEVFTLHQILGLTRSINSEHQVHCSLHGDLPYSAWTSLKNFLNGEVDEPHLHLEVINGKTFDFLNILFQAMLEQQEIPSNRSNDIESYSRYSNNFIGENSYIANKIKSFMGAFNDTTHHFIIGLNDKMIENLLEQYKQYCQPSNLEYLKDAMNIYGQRICLYQHELTLNSDQTENVGELINRLRQLYLSLVRLKDYNNSEFELLKCQNILSNFPVERVIQLQSRDDLYLAESFSLGELVNLIKQYVDTELEKRSTELMEYKSLPVKSAEYMRESFNYFIRPYFQRKSDNLTEISSLIRPGQ